MRKGGRPRYWILLVLIHWIHVDLYFLDWSHVDIMRWRSRAIVLDSEKWFSKKEFTTLFNKTLNHKTKIQKTMQICSDIDMYFSIFQQIIIWTLKITEENCEQCNKFCFWRKWELVSFYLNLIKTTVFRHTSFSKKLTQFYLKIGKVLAQLALVNLWMNIKTNNIWQKWKFHKQP